MDDAYVKKAKALMTSASAHVKLFEAHAKNIAADARIEYAKNLQVAKQRLKALHIRFNDLSEDTKDAWEEAQKEMEQSIEALEELIPEVQTPSEESADTQTKKASAD